ncbi:MAG: hypothetical protein KAS32_09170 [Candidatus Peribacteraceae bacterium]|nr:hypothetical protein [Candidatus Peribacteraceae bacterium]
MEMPESVKCRECGTIHPPVARGTCPVASGNAIAETEQGSVVVNFTGKLARFLNEKPNYEEYIVRIKNALGGELQ